MKRKKITFLALGKTSSISLSFNEISRISPRGLIEIFNSFAKIPLKHDNSLLVAGSLADKIDIDKSNPTPKNLIKNVLLDTGLSQDQVDNVEKDLLKGKTVIIEA